MTYTMETLRKKILECFVAWEISFDEKPHIGKENEYVELVKTELFGKLALGQLTEGEISDCTYYIIDRDNLYGKNGW